MRLTKHHYACAMAICESYNTNGDDVAEVWNDLRDLFRRSGLFKGLDISPRQLDVLADYGVRRLIKWGKL